MNYSVYEVMRRIALRVTIKDGIVYEGVLSLIHEDSIYAATVGFRKTGDFIVIKVYRGGLLEKITRIHDRVVLNLTHDPVILTSLAFRSLLLKNRSLVEYFTLIDEQPVLTHGLAYLVLDRVDIHEAKDYLLIIYKIAETKLREDVVIEPYTRCYSSVIELAVYLSKILALRRDQDIVNEYLKRADTIREIIYKTCNEEYIGFTRDLFIVVNSLIGQDSNQNSSQVTLWNNKSIQ